MFTAKVRPDEFCSDPDNRSLRSRRQCGHCPRVATLGVSSSGTVMLSQYCKVAIIDDFGLFVDFLVTALIDLTRMQDQVGDQRVMEERRKDGFDRLFMFSHDPHCMLRAQSEIALGPSGTQASYQLSRQPEWHPLRECVPLGCDLEAVSKIAIRNSSQQKEPKQTRNSRTCEHCQRYRRVRRYRKTFSSDSHFTRLSIHEYVRWMAAVCFG